MKEKFTITNIDRKRVLICRFGLRRHRQCADNNLFGCQRTSRILLTLVYGKFIQNVMYYQLVFFSKSFR